MLRKEQNGIAWLEFELLAEFKNLKSGVLLKHGGISLPPFDTLNMSFDCGDDAASVTANREKVRALFNMESLITSKQCHGKKIIEINKTAPNEPCDGLTTSTPHMGIAALHADCQAACFYDPINHAIGIAHAGWRGNVQNIYAEMIHFMEKRYGTKPSNLLVAISPSLGPLHAEFINYKTELPENFWPFQETPNHFNLWEIARQQLLEAGILKDHIQIAEICTYSDTKDCFSYRRSQTTGRMATFVMISP